MNLPLLDQALKAFGIEHEGATDAERRGQVYLLQDLVLKPAYDPVETQWVCDVLDGLSPSSEFRIAKPVRSNTGEWIAHGFTCQARLSGEHDMNRWNEALDASTALHSVLAAVEEPSWMRNSSAFYQRCDRFAWENEPFTTDDRAENTITSLRRFLRSIDPRNQVIHGDLAGNILFEPGQPPGIIDFTPYWRPALYASAIVVVDAISVRNASNKLIDEFLKRTDGEQMLLRAALFRGGTYGQQQFYDYFFAGFQQFTNALLDRID